MSTSANPEVLAGEVVPAASSEEIIRATDVVAEAAKYASERQLHLVDSLHELRLFMDALDLELRPLAASADNRAERSRLGQLAALVRDGLVGEWLLAHVGSNAEPLRDVGVVRSDRQLPEWFGRTPQGRAKRGSRCRRVAQIGVSELGLLYRAAAEAGQPLTQQMVQDRWRELFPQEAARASRRGRRPARDAAAVASLSGDAQLVYRALRKVRIEPDEALRRVTLLSGDPGLLRGAMIALGIEPDQ